MSFQYGLTKPQKLIYNMEKYYGGSISVICGSTVFKGYIDDKDLRFAINEMYRLNEALRLRILETGNGTRQTVSDFVEYDMDILHFKNESEMESYAAEYAKMPFDFYGNLCEIRPFVIQGGYGYIAKMHHIICDAWTMLMTGTQFWAIVNGEKVKAYNYTEYIADENKYLSGKKYDTDKAFFLDQFKTCEGVTYLTDKKCNTFETKRKSFIIDMANTKLINTFVENNHTTLFAVFTTALAIYVSRVKMNTEKFYIGTAVLNRSGLRQKNTMGMFVNTIPLLIELDNDKVFAENLVSVENSVFSAFRHQKYNYGDVLLDVRKEFGFGEPLYDVMISYQNATTTGETKSKWYHNGAQVESLQIHIHNWNCEAALQIDYDYQIEKFTEYEIDNIHKGILNLLFDAIKNDTKKLNQLRLLNTKAFNRIVYEFNNTSVKYSKNNCIHNLFEEQAIKTPGKMAVIACDKRLTFAELDEQSNRIANALVQKGIKKGDIVAFALRRKSSLISGIFGILKAGTAWLPLDPEYPKSRIEYILSDSNAKFFITDNNIGEIINNDCIDKPSVSVTGSDLCYCIYTSGSTGTPKGVKILHYNLANFCFGDNAINNLQYYILKNCNAVLGCGSITFDISNFEIVLSLLLGKTVVFANEQAVSDPHLLADLIIANKIDCVHCTPTKLYTYLANKAFALAFSQVKCVMVGGEQFSQDVYKKICKTSKAQIFNGYGPTETTMGVSFGEVNKNGITIGRPIQNTQLYILDKYLNPVPVGTVGELCVAGCGVGGGYINQPALTAEKFIENPFGAGFLFKTGDLAYWREDGNIIYVGRNDLQVKIRGLRIELGEIENIISSIPGILQTVVVVRNNKKGRQIICAFYTGKELNANEIRSMIGQKLPKYMLPHIYTHIDMMPLTYSGKVNRNALPEVDLAQISDVAECVPPANETEKLIVKFMERILNYSPIGRNYNFFEFGGDSLSAIELISALESAGYRTDIKTLFANATAQKLAIQLKKVLSQSVEQDITGDIPASAAQTRIYTAQAIQGGTAYNVTFAFRVKHLEPDRLQKAIQAMVDRYEILRTRFEERNGCLMQLIEQQINIIIEKLENDNISEFVRSFNLDKLPLFRIGYHGTTCIIDIHHIIMDGGSMPVFMRELNEFYMGRNIERLPVQYKKFAVQNLADESSKEYWLNIFSDEIPTLQLKTDYERKENYDRRGSAIYSSLSLDLHNKIEDVCRRKGITPFVFYMAGFYVLLSKFTGDEDIVVGTAISGREGEFLETIGMFTNTVALRNKPVGLKTIDKFLLEVKESNIEAMLHRHYSYSNLVKELNLKSEDHLNTLFDVMFVYQDKAVTNIVFGDTYAELLPVPVMTSKYDFSFNVMPRNKDIVIMAEYCTGLYREGTIKHFLHAYKIVLEQMLDTDLYLNNISILSDFEKETILKSFNNTAVEDINRDCVHKLFEQKVKEVPDKTALIASDAVLTYEDLNKMANKIAHSLIDKGISVGDIVAFSLTRKSYLVSCILGILKAGAAYLPIDSAFPQERINYILSDSKVKFYITDDNIDELLSFGNEANPATTVKKENLCYCIYTSGTTGLPKGVLITHASVSTFVHKNDVNAFQSSLITNCDTVICCNSVTFDIVLQEIFLPLVNGLTVVLFPDTKMDNRFFIDNLQWGGKYGLITTPTKLEMFLQDNFYCTKIIKNCSVIMSGAEIFLPSLFVQLRRYTDAIIFNGYGPTETTCGVLYSRIDNSEDISIGKPIANTQIYITDKYLKPVPIGVIGELCIAGDSVGIGYLNRAGLTAEKFVNNPFGKGKLYRTGDRAYWREDGSVVYVGRMDFQVKIHGLRIELGEIENAVSSINGILQAVAIVCQKNDGHQYISTYYTGAELANQEIRNELGKKLPKYMIPNVIMHLDELPLTSSGKIDRKELPIVDFDSSDYSVEYIKPNGILEQSLANIMEKVLHHSPIGRNDDFFAIGGDSLAAIEFASTAHCEGIYFPLQSVFDNPTVKLLAANIEKSDKKAVCYKEEDFADIEQLLEKNNNQTLQKPKEVSVGNILITGATGYLGAHILADYLEHDTGTAYCLVRGKKQSESEERLSEVLKFYFNDKYSGNNRINVICGDLQQNSFGLQDEVYFKLASSVKMVINAAASVKHFGVYNYFYETNVKTVKRLADFCHDSDVKLIHVSTLSVSGNSFGDDFNGYVSDKEKQFSEKNLFIGQPLDNVYIRSKFEAEKEVFRAMLKGLAANVVRMGNLTNRLSDGVFQINYNTNAFLKRFKGILELEVYPNYLSDIYVEFTPVDEAAHAIMEIARHFNTKQTVFHINSTKVIYVKKLVEYLNGCGYNMKAVSGKEFIEKLHQVVGQDNAEQVVGTLINDIDEEGKMKFDSKIHIENSYTEEYLKRIGFYWSELGMEYIKKYISYFRKIGYL